MSEFNNILALDTALVGTTACVVADEVSHVRSEVMARGQAEYLVPFAQEALEACNLEYADLDAILCTIGPGAFTGLRIAMSAARAFSLSLELPLFGITTLQAIGLNYAHVEQRTCFVVVETKRQDFYVQSFDACGKAVSDMAALQADEVVGIVPEGAVLIGDAVSRLIEACPKLSDFETGMDYPLPDMVQIAQLLQKQGSDGEAFSLNPEPVYLREADVSLQKTKPRVLEGGSHSI